MKYQLMSVVLLTAWSLATACTDNSAEEETSRNDADGESDVSGKADDLSQASSSMVLPEDRTRQITVRCPDEATQGCNIFVSATFDGPFPFKARYANVDPRVRIRRFAPDSSTALFSTEGDLGGFVPGYDDPPPSVQATDIVAVGKHLYKFDVRNLAEVKEQLEDIGLASYKIRFAVWVRKIHAPVTPRACDFAYQCDSGEACENGYCAEFECESNDDCVFDGDDAYLAGTCSACTGDTCTGVGRCVFAECGPDSPNETCPGGLSCVDQQCRPEDPIGNGGDQGE